MDPHVLQEVIISVGYRLLRLHTFDGTYLEDKLESVCHIALTAFMTTLFLQIGRRRFLQYRLVGGCLNEVVNRGLDNADQELMLWLLFVGGISVVPEEDEHWLCTSIQQVARRRGIEDWTEMHRCLRQFPWIGSVHDESGKQLWDLSRTDVHRIA
jgi:hypothetical protein